MCLCATSVHTKNTLGQVNYFFGRVAKVQMGHKNVISKKEEMLKAHLCILEEWRSSVGHDSTAGQQRIFLYFFPIKTGGPEGFNHWVRYSRVTADRENWNWDERRRQDTNQESVRKLSRVAFWGVIRALQSDINICYTPQTSAPH